MTSLTTAQVSSTTSPSASASSAPVSGVGGSLNKPPSKWRPFSLHLSLSSSSHQSPSPLPSPSSSSSSSPIITASTSTPTLTPTSSPSSICTHKPSLSNSSSTSTCHMLSPCGSPSTSPIIAPEAPCTPPLHSTQTHHTPVYSNSLSIPHLLTTHSNSAPSASCNDTGSSTTTTSTSITPPPSPRLFVGGGGSEGGQSEASEYDDALSWCSADSTSSSTSSHNSQGGHHRPNILNVSGSIGSSGGLSEAGNSSCGSVGSKITPSSTPTLPTSLNITSRGSPVKSVALSKQIIEKKNAEAKLRKQKREAIILSALPNWKLLLSKPWPANPRKDKVLKSLLQVCVPPSVRGAVWEKLIQNELMISAELYQVMQHQYSIVVKHALGRADSKQLIETDIESTFPYLNLFKVGCPFYDSLKSLVQAYIAYRPDIGYVPGMSHICAVLLLNIDKQHICFTCLANIFNSRIHRAFSSGNAGGGITIENYLSAFDIMLKAHIPNVHSHFASLGITVDMFAIDCVVTLMSKVLPLDCVVRIWDLYFCAGEQFLMRVMVAWIRYMRPALLQADFAQCVALVTKGGNATTQCVGSISWEELYGHVKAIPRIKTVKWENFIKTTKPLSKTPSSKQKF
ncbi:TBC1 domain family member 14 [Pelomyxa schiedti]|nr:TBC1 domain family member 14 [Pelomyxa schiedti]